MKINSTTIQNLESIETIAISHVGPYAGIAGAFERLAAWAGVHNLWAAAPKMLGVYHDDPMQTPMDQLRSEACLENLSGMEPGEGMKPYTVSGGKYFVMQVELIMSEYGEAWQQAYETFNQERYVSDDRDHYEFYISCADQTQGANAPWVVELRIPMK
ncbi:MAG: AraC family transcriptional regulator [Bacteroidia bacterium]|nr:AraC family transcriptional regulator [Bacteroidia bacterium]